jgi:hypothetical protein
MWRAGIDTGLHYPVSLHAQRHAKKARVELLEAITASGETPLDYMLRVMRDPTVETTRRDYKAKAGAPYCHAVKPSDFWA